MTFPLLTNVYLCLPVVLGHGAAGPPEQKDQEQTQNLTASRNPPRPVPGPRSCLLCYGKIIIIMWQKVTSPIIFCTTAKPIEKQMDSPHLMLHTTL